MFYEITQYFRIVARILAVFAGSLVFFIIIRKIAEEALIEINTRRIKNIDAALGGLADLTKGNIRDAISKVLKNASFYELTYVLGQMKKFPETPRKNMLYKFIRYSGKIKNVRKAAIQGGRRRRRIIAIRILGKLNSETLVHVLKDIIDKSNDPDIIYAAIQALGEIESPLAVDTIISLLGANKFSNSKISAILETLEYPILTNSLRWRSSKDYIVRFWIANFLGNYKSENAFQALLEMLEDENPNVRAAACESLGRTGNEKAIGFLYKFLDDDSWFVRLHAIKALGQFRFVGSINKIIPSLRDRNWWVRYNAKSVLKRFGPEVISYMHPVLKDEDRFARNSAVEILEETGSADRMFSKLILENAPDRDTYNFFIDFVKAEGALWLKSRLNEVDEWKRRSVLELIEKKDHNIYQKMSGTDFPAGN